MVVPGSRPVKKAAEKIGLDQIFKEAGFEWREPGCSMCLGMNPDRVPEYVHVPQRLTVTLLAVKEKIHAPILLSSHGAAAAIHGHFVDGKKEVGEN